MPSAEKPELGDIQHLDEKETIRTSPVDGLGQGDTFLTVVNRVKEHVQEQRLVLNSKSKKYDPSDSRS